MSYNPNSGYGRNWLQSIMNMKPAHGKVYFVAKAGGSTGNLNASMINEIIKYDPDGDIRIFGTVAEAITEVNARINWSGSPWGNGDIIFILPGQYAEALTSLPHGASMIGLGHDIRDAQNGVRIQPAAGSAVDVGAVVNTYFENIWFQGNATYRAFDSTITNNCHFKNCGFSGPAETTTLTEAFYCSDSVKTTFDNCRFCNAGYGIRFEYVDANDSVSYLDMNNCLITGVSTCGIYTSANLVGPHSVVRNTIVAGGGQTITKAVDDNSNLFDYAWSTFEGTTATEGGRSYNGCYGNGALIT